MELTEIEDAKAAELTGAEIDQKGMVVYSPDDNPPYFAVGFRAQKSKGYFKLFWFYKVKFGITNKDFQTKGETLTFQTAKLEGVIAAGDLSDSRGKHPWKSELDVTEENAAEDIVTGWFNAVVIPDFAAP